MRILGLSYENLHVSNKTNFRKRASDLENNFDKESQKGEKLIFQVLFF